MRRVLVAIALGGFVLLGASMAVAVAAISGPSTPSALPTWGESGGDPSAPAAVAESYALAQVGTPYLWGGEAPGAGFDCSGLVQAAWAAAGVHLPRVAEDQLYAGPILPAGAALEPGDLVFFGPGPGQATHVGLVVDPSGTMVDAPYTGAVVRVEKFPPIPGQRWGNDLMIGATRPGV